MTSPRRCYCLFIGLMGILLVGSGKGRKFKMKGGKKKPYFGNAGYLTTIY